MIFYGFYEVFSIYIVTVLEIRNELFLSNIFTIAMFALFLFNMFGIDTNFFEKNENSNLNPHNNIFPFLTVGALTFVLIFLIRFFQSANVYLILVVSMIIFAFFSIVSSKIIGDSNYLIERIALYCGDDADHVRNIA